MGSITEEKYRELIESAKQVFVPYMPVKLVELFQGRGDVIRRVVEELNTPGRHVVLYGD